MSGDAAVTRASRRILVADDDDAVRVGLVANLELEGYQVVEARDGTHAIALLAEQAFDLIVSDVVMPGASGAEVLSAARQRGLQTPFILVSAFATDQVVTQALDEGLFAMLHKPFPIEHLLHVVARAVERNVVILVHDEHTDVVALAAALRGVALQVETCRDTSSAVELVASKRVDVCVLDLATDPQAGLASCEALRRADPQLDIIALTELGEQEQVRRIIQRGATCLSKPFETRELLTSIARVRALARVHK